MELNEITYYTEEMNMKYVSASQYKMFYNPYSNCCEAAALAEIKGEYIKPISKALIIGSYVDEALTGDLEKFKSEHPELFVTRGDRKGELKSDYLRRLQQPHGVFFRHRQENLRTLLLR